jgi:diguanylate cyclase (GGDEF)-like protein/PAS domain S-box-containing protein
MCSRVRNHKRPYLSVCWRTYREDVLAAAATLTLPASLLVLAMTNEIVPDNGCGSPAPSKVAQLNRVLRMLSGSNQALIHVTDEATLLQEVCRIVVEVGGYRMAMVAFAEQDEAKTLRPVAHAGFEAGYGESVNLSWSADSEWGGGPAGVALRSGQPCTSHDIAGDPSFAPWRDDALRRQYRSVIALPLTGDGRTFGVLAIYAVDADAFDAEELPILTELAGDLAFGVMTLRAGVERQGVEKAIHAAQQVFRALVENSPDIIARYDHDCRRTYVNPKYLEVAQIAEQDLLGTAPSSRSPLPAASAAVLQNLLRVVLNSGVAECMDIAWPQAGATHGCYNVCAFPELDREGRVVGVMTVSRDITELKRAAQERVAHLRYFENMDRVNRAIQQAKDIEQMMSDVLDIVLSIFACDRASLVYPCDPAAVSWRVPMERTRPDCPGLFAQGIEIPMAPDQARMFQASRMSDAPVRFGTGSAYPPPPGMEEQFGELFGLGLAIYPKVGKPWEFMVQHCSGPWAWTAEDERIFQEIGRRLADGLTSLQAYRDLGESETRLRTLVQSIPDLVWLKDTEGVFLTCNPQFERAVAMPQAAVVGRTDYDFVDKELADFFRENDRKAMVAGRPCTNEEWITFADNGYRGLFETTKTPMRDEAGRVIGVLGIARDITERRKIEEQVRIAATAFEAQEGIVITDADRRILRVNRAFSDITGYAPEDVVGQTPRLLKSGRHDDVFYQAMWDRIRGEGSWQGEIWNRRKSGEIYPEWLNITGVKNDRGEISHYVGTLIDITARKAAEQEIEHLAFYDLLTHLPNRRLLQDRLHQALAGSARSRRKGALLLIDLDNFKILNDTSGHDVGDQLLVEVAGRLVGCVRDGDTIARLGGDEFVVMLEDLSESPQEAAAQAKGVGEKILSALNQSYAIADREHHSTPSIGITLFIDVEDSVEELLKQADIAMYQAKAAGRNTLRFFDPQMQATLAARAVLEAALRLAIQGRQFVLHYQPQVDGARVIGAEALIRWEHPERGMVLPAEFIPLAEETGLIVLIGQWVLEAACARLRAWAGDPRTGALQLAINVSAREFRRADFVDQVRVALMNAGAPAARLKLELTESVVLDDIEDTIEKMRALKQLGVGFSMDDFGTGYSSLSYLTRLPLDQLKIDQSFVHKLPASGNDAVVVQTIISLAKSLGLTVIAEGVETEAQRDFLDRHGCSAYQGYLFSKPVALSAFEPLLT